MSRYATGSKAWFLCSRCGLRGRYNDRVREVETGVYVHPACEDEPMRRRPRRPDAIRLRDPRPDPDITPME